MFVHVNTHMVHLPATTDNGGIPKPYISMDSKIVVSRSAARREIGLSAFTLLPFNLLDSAVFLCSDIC